uniref:regenerating islet-derived protein 3-beta-like n=1 Tax=Jaculus jaculus TaxID=51337 RepID=UPI001E1B0F8A|nr:regenerating islet-derived protein 3-beta-like [Jaculus jaculus]
MLPPVASTVLSLMLLSCLMLLSQVQGHLVSVLSAEENSYVSSFLKSRVHNYLYVWIGLHDPILGYESHGDAWQWSNNNKLKYVNWERNPFTAIDRGYCASLTAKSGYMKWRDYPCDMLLPYVCKFKN